MALPAGNADAEDAAVFDFRCDYLEDLEGGRGLPLAAYLERYPEHQEAVAAEYLRLRRETAQEAAGVPERAQETLQRIGPYRLLRQLGRGGQGAVWLAEDTRLDRRVALKLLSDTIVTGERRARLRREAQIASRLAHPGICSILEAEVEGEVPYIAMPLVPGEDLAGSLSRAQEDWDAEARELPWIPCDRTQLVRALRFFEEAARALQAAHSAGLVHRDIKPGNIMVTPAEEPVLLDFGLARDVDELDGLTRSGEVFGTPHYMAPEQHRGFREVDHRVDVFALGVTIYEALTGERPFEGATRYDVQRAALLDSLPNPRAHNVALTRDVRVVLEMATDKDPARRYATAGALAEDLRRICDHEPVAARPAGPALRLARWVRRQPALAASAATIVVALIAGLILSLFLLKRANDHLDRAVGRQYARRALEQVQESPDKALALGIEAVELLPDHQVRSGLFELLEECRARTILNATVGTTRFWDLALAQDLAVGALGLHGAEGGFDGALQVWDLDSGEPLHELRLPGEPVRCLDLSPDGSLAVAGTEAGSVLGFDPRAGDLTFRVDAPSHAEGTPVVLWVEVAPDGGSFVAQRAGGDCVRYSLPEPLELARFPTAPGTAGLARFSPDGSRLLTASRSNAGTPPTAANEAVIWDAETGEELAVLAGHRGPIAWAEWSSRGVAVTASIDGTARLWDGSGRPAGPVLHHDGPLLRTSFDPTGARLATTGEENGVPVLVWSLDDALQHGPVLRLEGHRSRVTNAAWSPDGERLATTSWDRSIHVWNTENGELEITCRQILRPAASRWSADGRRLVTWTVGTRAFVWAVGEMPWLYRLRGHVGGVLRAEFLGGGTRAVTVGEDGSVRLWRTPRGDEPGADWSSGEALAVLGGHPGGIRHAVLGAGERVLVTAGETGDVRRWDLEQALESGASFSAGEPIAALALASDGGHAAATTESGALWLIPFDGAREPLRIESSGDAQLVAFSPDAARLATVGKGEVHVLAVPGGEELLRLPLPPPPEGGHGGVLDLRWRPDGGELAALDGDGRLHSWTPDGEPLAEGASCPAGRFLWAPRGRRVLGWDEASLGGGRLALIDLDRPLLTPVRPRGALKGKTSSVAIDPTGEWFAAASLSGTVQVWSARTGELLVRHDRHTGPVTHVVFDQDAPEPRLLTASMDGTAAVWFADPLPAARARRPRLLDEHELRQELELAVGR